MNCRIRYSKLADGSWVSMRVIRGEGNEYRSYILPDGKSGFVEDLTSKMTTPVVGSSPHKVKIELKKLLKNLGCRFTAESRGEV